MFTYCYSCLPFQLFQYQIIIQVFQIANGKTYKFRYSNWKSRTYGVNCTINLLIIDYY